MIITNFLNIDDRDQKVFVIPHEPCWFSYDDVRFMLDAAFNGGITYWCERIEFDPDAYKLHMVAPDKYGLYIYDRFLQYGRMTVTDCDGESHVLTVEDFFSAIEKSVDAGELPMEYVSDPRYARIDVADVDAWIADNIFQRAVYGDVIYC